MLTKLWGLRWWMMGLLMLGSIINYLTRATLAVAAPTVLKDLDITTQQYSWILSAFQFAIMLQPLCGYVMDSVGLKLGFAIFAIAWSFISMAHGLASSWQTLFGLRALLGFAEGSANPAGMKATSEWFPAPRTRPRRRLLQHGRVAGLDARGAARRVGDPDAQLAVRVRAHRRDWTRLGRALAAVLSISRRSTKRSHREERDYILSGQESHLAGEGKPSFRTIAWPAELLGHRHPEVSCRSDVGHADVLAAALSDDRAWIRSEADRDVRVAAVPRRRSRAACSAARSALRCRSAVWV